MSSNHLALLFALPGAISMSVGIGIWRRRLSEVDALLALLMFATVFWSLGYSLELASHTAVFFWLWGVVQYVGIACSPVFFFMLMVHYAGVEAWLTRRAIGVLWTIPVLTVIFRITTPFHGLIHQSTEIYVSGASVFQIHQPGPWFWVTIGYSYLMLLGGVMILLHFRSSARVIHRRHMTLLVLGSLAPLAGSIAYITGHRPLGHVDLTPMGFAFTGLAVAWGALRHRVLEVMPVARTALVDGFPDGLMMLSTRGRIEDMNATAGRMLRLDINSSLGKGFEEVLAQWPPLMNLCYRGIEDRVEFVDSHGGEREAPTHLEARLTYLRQHLDEISAYLVVITDITDRKRAEELLSKSEALYHDLVETAQDLIWQCDADGRFTYLNHAWEEVFGFTIGEMLGKKFSDFQKEPGVSADAPEFVQLMQHGSPKGHEIVSLGQNGREIHLIVKGKCVYDDHGDVIGTRGTAHDMTARKRVEEQLRQAMKMEAVGQLAGGVAHDFNNMLQAIQGYTELALHEVPVEHPAHLLFEAVAKGADRATAMVKQLLAFGRRQIIRPEYLDLNDVIAAFLNILHRVIGEHIQINFVKGLLLGSIFADRGQLEQIIMNLSVNARDAMPEGGKLRIETANVYFDDAYCVAHPWAQPGAYVMLAVRDSGSGMDADTMEHIWEPFFTTKSAGRGTGLGLATVYGIVQQHGGLIDVASTPGKGTTFKIYFPRKEAPATPIEPEEEIHLLGGNETILLAEDEEPVRALVCRVLEQAGYTVFCAENGQEALDTARDHGGKADLALLDVVMPVQGGRATYEQLKALYPQMRFLFISGYNADMVNASFVLDQGLELIQKPFNWQLLLHKIRESLDQK